MKAVESTLDRLKAASAKSDSVLVSYSDGKDSRAVMDLCQRSFKTVKAFFMYFIPGLEYIETRLAEAEQRYGIKIARYPHWVLGKCLRNNVYRSEWYGNDDVIPEWTLKEVHTLARADSGCKIIAIGAKKSDGGWRRRTLWQIDDPDKYVLPIVDWSKEELMAYLARRNISAPDAEGGRISGADLSTPFLLWLNDKHPEDFKRLLEVFPFAEAVVWRRMFYGDKNGVHDLPASKHKFVIRNRVVV